MANTEYITKPEWLAGLDSLPPDLRAWWTDFRQGIADRMPKKLVPKYSAKGFLRLRFYDVGLCNSFAWDPKGYLKLGYEQVATTPSRAMRKKFVPVIEEWLMSRTWGSPTVLESPDHSHYRELSTHQFSTLTAVTAVDEFMELIANLNGVVSSR